MKREAEQEINHLEDEIREKKEEIKDEEPKVEKLPKQRVAIIVGYNGSNFSGSQKYLFIS